MKDKLKEGINKVLGGFFQEEQGNRVTTNNLNGLAGKIYAVIDETFKGDESGKREKSAGNKTEKGEG